MSKKYTVHYMGIGKLVKPMPISNEQLRSLAEKTRLEIEEKIRRRESGELLESDEDEVITKWL